MPVFMKRLLFLLGAFLVLLLTSFTYHRLALQREKASLTPKGQLVAVNGHKMSVLVKGNGPQTLVFLSGAGTASPILDFKDVYDGLSSNYRIVLVERAGYGYSEDTSQSRDVAVVLSETRQALVVGLDWAFPESYSHLKRHPQMLRLARWGSQLGLLRLLPRQLYVPNETLSDSDRRLYQEIAYRQLLSQAMLNESLCVKENAKKVNSTSIKSQMPVLLMVSNGKGTGFSQEQWRHYATSFAKNQENIELAFYDAPHYFYHYQTKEVIRSIEDFIQEKTD